MALIGATNEMDATKQEKILSVVQKELQFKAKLVSTITDVSKFAKKGLDKISFPKLSSFTVEKRAPGAAFTEKVITSTKDTLDLDQIAGVLYIIDPAEEIESTLEWELESAARAAAAVARGVDVDIIAALELHGVVNGTAGDITRDIILNMREDMFDRHADDQEFTLLVANDQEKALLKIDEFKNQDIYGPNGAVRTGQIGTVYGVPVLRHSGLTAGTFYYYAKEAMCVGFQKMPKMGQQPAVEFGADAKKTVIDAKYGVSGKQLNPGFGLGATDSAWIMKDGV